MSDFPLTDKNKKHISKIFESLSLAACHKIDEAFPDTSEKLRSSLKFSYQFYYEKANFLFRQLKGETQN
jgi:hypothetical protein